MASLAAATALRNDGSPGCFVLELDPEWTANGHCTAGYLAGVAARAALEDDRAGFPAVTALSARYLRVTPPGPARVEVERLRVGEGGAEWRVSLHVAGRLCVDASVGTGPRRGPGRRLAPPGLPALSDCILLPTQAPGFDLPVMGVLAQYADPDGLGWLAGQPSGRGRAQGWVHPADRSDPDQLTLLAAFDSIPTATFDLGLDGWAATTDLSVHVLGSPAPGPLRLRRQVRATADDLVSLACDVWDADGSLVATGAQLCSLRR
jgi:acyl-coenzyme A thioesterase PaaI-like protein